MPKIAVELAGLKLSNPTMLAAGVLGTSASLLRRAVEAGAGAVVTKSIGLEPRVGYPNPTVVRVPYGLINALGLPNPGVKEFAHEIREAKGAVPIIVSVYGFSSDELSKVASMAVDVGADAVELNLSCPHVKGTGSELGQDPKVLADVVMAVKDAVNKPIFVKLTPNVTDVVAIAKAAEEAGADALTAINTVKAMAIDVETARPILANKIGGLSGPAIKPIAIRCVYEIYEKVEIPIVGCGGITTWRDAVEFLLAGASAVQIGTAVALRGLDVFRSIVKGIESYVRRKGFRSVKEIVGLSHKL